MMHLVPGIQPLQPPPTKSVQDYEAPTPGSWLTLLNSPDPQSSPDSTDNDTSPQTQQARPVAQVRAEVSPADDSDTSSSKGSQGADRRGGTTSGSSRRTVFTRHQITQLEARFREQTFLSKEERAQLAEDLGLAERQIMIWFQNRRGRLKRRGPSDTAYTADKLKELNTRRPYPFLYGLLSSMQYRYPDTHHHPYQHLVPDRTSPKDDSRPSDTPTQGPCGGIPSRYPHPAGVPTLQTLPRDVTPTDTAPSAGVNSGSIPLNVTLTNVSNQGPMPPNVTVHQMAWPHHGGSGPSFRGDYNIRPMYPTGHAGWERSRAGPIRGQTAHMYPHQRQQMPVGHPYCPTSYWPVTSPPPPHPYLLSPTNNNTGTNNGRPAPAPAAAFHVRLPQTPLSQTTTPCTTHTTEPSPAGDTRPTVTTPPAGPAHCSPVSPASAGSPGCDQVGGRFSMQTSTCLGPNAAVLETFSSPLLAAGPNYDFNPQIDFNSYVPDFPDITSTLYPYTQQTC